MARASFSAPPKTTSLLVVAVVKPIWVRSRPGQLVRVARGTVFDVAVDIRRSSPTFGKVACVELSDANQRMFWLPPGLAHGFLVVSELADFLYKTTDYYAPEHERCILWNDAELAIPWPLTGVPNLSAKDVKGVPFAVAELFP